MSQANPGVGRRALVLTTSDRSAAGERDDTSGRAIADRLASLGFKVEREIIPDEQPDIQTAIARATETNNLVVTTGGTGLTPRDVTPQATAAVIDYPVPGLSELMRAEGRRSTPMAVLSRGLAGVRGRCLVVNLPGSPRGAVESLEAIVPVLDHALETLAGPFDHAAAATHGGRPDLPQGEPG